MKTIKLNNGKEYKVYFDFNALCEYENRTGLSMSQIEVGIDKISTIRELLYCGLLRHHEEAFSDPKELGDHLSFKHLAQYVAVLAEALKIAFGTAEADNTSSGTTKKNSSG